MRAKESRKWVDKIEKTSKGTQERQGSSRKRKMPPVDSAAEDNGKTTLAKLRHGNRAPPPPPTPSQVIDMSVIYDEYDSDSRDALPTFPYKPLDNSKLEIRIVTLKPGVNYSPIECTIEHVATGKGSFYKALSYTWGSPEIQKTILLDGIQVQVRENLWQALYHLRSEDRPLRVWMDAICINQNDIPERSHQVSRMGTLYGMADEVLVWLGPERDGSDKALEFLAKNMTTGSKAPPPTFISDLSSSPIWQAIVNLTRRDYWARTWIIQEVFRARKISIHCGHERLPWIYLAKLFRIIDKNQGLNGIHEDLPELRQSFANKLTKNRTAQDPDLERLLRTYKSSLCSDPRDKVYSLLGLAGRRICATASKRSTSGWIVVDYSKSAQELFESLALSFYGEGGFSDESFTSSTKLEIMRQREFLQVQRMQLLQEILGLHPSWQSGQGLRIRHAGRTVSPSEKAAQELRCGFQYKNIVSRIGPTWQHGTNKAEIVDWYSQFHGVDMPSSFALETTLASLTDENVARLRTSDPVRHDTEVTDEDQEYLRALSEIRLFTTHNGRLGITSCDIHPGYEVARFDGCDVSVVFRPDGYGSLVKGRAFILKSDRRPSRGMGLSSSEAAGFRYGTPDVLDDNDFNFKDADVIGMGIIPNRKSYVARKSTLTLTLRDWQALTW